MRNLFSESRLEITTRIGCKINCNYCPQYLLVKCYNEKYGEAEIDMSIDIFKSCVNKLPLNTRIDFSGMCEPWLNPDCTEMLMYATKRGHPVAVYTTLDGMTLNDWQIIKSIKYECFVLHLPDSQSNSFISITPEYLDILNEAVSIKTYDGSSFISYYSCHGDIHPDVTDIIPTNVQIRKKMHDRAGNVNDPSLQHYQHKDIIICKNSKFSLNHNVLLPNGTVLLCCMDYGMKHILGNLLEQSWEELHMSKKWRLLRKSFFDSSIDTLCRSCTNAVHPIAISTTAIHPNA